MNKEEKNSIIEATRLIGRNSQYIRKVLSDSMIVAWNKTMMINPLQARRDEKNRVIATTRLLHYANTADIARKIASALMPNDKEFELGVATAALYHDFGQSPFGHEGEAILRYVSKQNNSGSLLHNIEGAMAILYREKTKIIEAINEGEKNRILQDEANKRKITVEELEERRAGGKEQKLDKKITQKIEEQRELSETAVQVIAMSAGNHNGERGRANIIPDETRTFKDFYNSAQKTYIDEKEDKKMSNCSIVDSIVKIADQISSIPYDIIDAKRAGLEDEIFPGWAIPIAQILEISVDEAKEKLKGNDKELDELARNLQQKFIDDISINSDMNEIKMNDRLAQLLYGVIDRQGNPVVYGLRSYNMAEHIAFTSTNKTETLLKKAIFQLTDKLTEKILDKNGVFPTELNEIFRISGNSSLRKMKEEELMKQYSGGEECRDFYKYAVQLSSEEYQALKKIIKKCESQYFRDIIEKTVRNKKNIEYNILPRSARGSTGYLIEAYILSHEYIAMVQESDGGYSNEEIENIIFRINSFLKENPIEGKKHLPLQIKRHRYELDPLNGTTIEMTEKYETNTDREIAARLAVSYLNRLNNLQILDLAKDLGILNEKERAEFEKPYIKYSPKRNGESGHLADSAKKAIEDYSDTTPSIDNEEGR